MENPKEEIEAILNEMNFTNPFEVQKELFNLPMEAILK